MRREPIERGERILERPARIPRVEVDAHDIGARLLDKREQFARLHVARMVLDRDLHAGIEGARPCLLEHGDRVGDPRADAARREPVVAIAEDDPKRLRPERPRHADAEREVLVRRAPVLLEPRRRRADAPRAELDRHVPLRAVAADLGERRVVEGAAERAEVGDEDGITAERDGLIDEGPGILLEAAEREIIEAQSDAAATDRSGRSRRGAVRAVARRADEGGRNRGGGREEPAAIPWRRHRAAPSERSSIR